MKLNHFYFSKKKQKITPNCAIPFRGSFFRTYTSFFSNSTSFHFGQRLTDDYLSDDRRRGRMCGAADQPEPVYALARGPLLGHLGTEFSRTIRRTGRCGSILVGCLSRPGATHPQSRLRHARQIDSWTKGKAVSTFSTFPAQHSICFKIPVNFGLNLNFINKLSYLNVVVF